MIRLLPVMFAWLFFCLFISRSAYAQTEDTLSTIVQSEPADTGRSSASPYKKQVSEMVKSMVEQKQFLPLSFTVRKTKYRIEKDARQYKLPSGPSRVALFKLPDYAWEYILRIRSLKYGVEYIFHTFSPSGVFLDSAFWPTHLLSEKNFLLSTPRSASTVGLEAEVPMGEYRKNDRYLLIYTIINSARLATYVDATQGLLISLFKHPVEKSAYGRLELEVHRR